MRPRISIRESVRPSVRPSLGQSVHPRVTLSSKTGKLMILIANNDVSWNHIIIQSFHHHEDASLALWALLFHHLHFGIIVDIVVLSSLLSLLVYSLYCYFHVIVSFHFVIIAIFPFFLLSWLSSLSFIIVIILSPWSLLFCHYHCHLCHHCHCLNCCH